MARAPRRATIKPSEVEMAKCAKVFRHRWDDCPPDKGADIGALCDRCGSTRMDTIKDALGNVRRRYKHSPEYRAFLDRGYIPTANQARLEYVQYLQRQAARAAKKKPTKRTPKKRNGHA